MRLLAARKTVATGRARRAVNRVVLPSSSVESGMGFSEQVPDTAAETGESSWLVLPSLPFSLVVIRVVGSGDVADRQQFSSSSCLDDLQ